ncbi:MAG: DUF4491 family protein [Paramuribaculum sp.]|nr:DUF4491 family protein [Paramuribaculum sp.]
MTELLSSYHLLGLFIGLCTFLIIGLFHPVVIKCHYYFGTGCWWWFVVLGVICAAISVVVEDVVWSTLLGVVAFSSFWTVREIFDQEKRVRKGWFPRNPARESKEASRSDKITD